MLAKLNIINLFSYLQYVGGNKLKNVNEYNKFIELKKIMKRDSISTYYQPIQSLENSETIGYEALNRPPTSKSFPTTEGFYDYIGQTNQVFTFELYCRNKSLKKFNNAVQDFPSQADKLIFINIHPQVLVDGNYKSGETLQLLESLNISPSQVVFELTEKKAVTDYVMFEKVLSHYRSQGFRIAIDDAGSGYNSLKSLVHLKPEFIKLDKSLIHGIHCSMEQQKMVTLLLDFANQSNTSVIAEGIEQTKDLEYLKRVKVHFGQGFALGRPSKKLM